ncbi:hypothetical protein GCM10012275_16900 [Longimycelium tulufanense]|uniref:Squalene cyclase C-terminal domain-containing protein n=2 Tax=Longimycelium tulufanense TaxID=907463 RepID=A0A8J3CCA3_9PSEU|nr:hypothetical protein GCM10012275_16900 [Longimycelium tulufanense]
MLPGRQVDQRRGSGEALLSEIVADPLGGVSPSVYETARLVRLAPWLAGHRERLRFLLDRQHPDGTWGGPGCYSLVPTLSATEALLALLVGATPVRAPAMARPAMASAIRRALGALSDWLVPGNHTPVPDTIAAELVIPALVADVNGHLEHLAAHRVAELSGWCVPGRLSMPPGVDEGVLHQLRDMIRHGRTPPAKLLHSLEALGPITRGAAVVPHEHGVVGCSPAATAAWLGRPPAGRHQDSVEYLRAVQERHGGPVPGVAPVPFFELSWVLAALTADLVPMVPPALLDRLYAAVGPDGVPAGPGLPPDADDTATVLCVLAQWGRPVPPDCLWSYRGNAHFSCFHAERTPSISTNAHVLQALGMAVNRGLLQGRHAENAIDELVSWLGKSQQDEGNWWDKWHASPYYATACCALALARHGGERAARMVEQAVDWVLGTQRDDGSWGRWVGTPEESAYAIQTLLRAPASAPEKRLNHAVARGYTFLEATRAEHDHLPLWHDKDLYAPLRVVQAEVMAAIHLTRTSARLTPAPRRPS